MKKFYFSALAVVLSFSSLAQTSSNHLLWRISGKGLSKPSYLFGTMHLNDKRLFHFGDSLYHALEQSDGFAAELDFNSAFSQYLNEAIEKNISERYLKKQIDSSVLKKNKRALEKKFGKGVDEITMEDLKKEETRQQMRSLRSGEMEAFMDAYLFGLADNQGKWVGGIEDPEDQLGLEEKFDLEGRINGVVGEKSTEKKQLEWMIQAYLNENLNLIDRSSHLWKGARDLILIKRNIKMAYRMDSLANVRSNLFAVGAAHLPGDSGLVSLLREKGYSVTPVISSTKIDPAKYTYKQVTKPWLDVWGSDSLYTVQMPMQARPVRAVPGTPYTMLFHYDPVATAAYFTLSIVVGNASAGAKDSMMNNLVTYYRKTATSLKEKDISLMGYPGKEILFESDEGAVRIQTFIPGNYIVMNLVSGLNERSLLSEKSNRFLASFRPDTARAATLARIQAAGWRETRYTDEGFSLMTPAKMTRNAVKMDESTGWTRNTYATVDPVTGFYFAVIADAVTRGHYLEKDSVYFKQMESAVVENTKGKLVSSRSIVFQDQPASESLITVEKNGVEYLTKLIFFGKGNRRYTLFKTSDPKKEVDDADPFFRSFRFLQFSADKWNKAIVRGHFTTFSPENSFTIDTTSGSRLVFSAYDTAAATTFSILKESFPGYFWVENDSVLYADRIKTFLGEGDSLLQRNVVKNGKSDGIDLLIRMKSTNLLKKMRLVLNADTLYTLYSYLPAELLNTTGFKRFFEDFRPLNEGGATSIFGDGAKRLLDALPTTDSASFEQAKAAIANAPFNYNDLPLLQKAMLLTYLDYDTSTYFWKHTSNAEIMDKMIALDTAGTNVDFVRKNYHSLTGNRAHLKLLMLNILGSNKTTASYDLLRVLLKEPLPSAKTYFDIDGLTDSLSLSKQLFPQAFAMLDNRITRYQFADLARMLSDSGYMNVSMIREHKPQLMKLAAQPLTLTADELKDESYEYAPVIELVRRLNDKEANDLLRRLGKIQALDIALDAWTGLLKNKQVVTTNDLLSLAKSDEYRSSLYINLDNLGKKELFPKAYLTQRFMAQGILFNVAYEDDVELERIVFIKEKIAEFRGVKKKFYLFKLTLEDEEGSFLGIAGPYSTDSKDLETDSSATGIYWDEVLNAEKTDAQFAAFIKKLLENESSEEGDEE